MRLTLKPAYTIRYNVANKMQHLGVAGDIAPSGEYLGH